MAKPGEVQLGDRVRDEVTGLEGIAVGVTTWLNGCRRLVLQPKAVEGKVPDSVAVDEPSIVVLERRIVRGQNIGDSAVDVREALTSGGPAPTPRNYQTPRS